MKRKITEQLVAWKNSLSRKPLIINGARQVGKTFILREFGRTDDVISIPLYAAFLI